MKLSGVLLTIALLPTALSSNHLPQSRQQHSPGHHQPLSKRLDLSNPRVLELLRALGKAKRAPQSGLDDGDGFLNGLLGGGTSSQTSSLSTASSALSTGKSISSATSAVSTTDSDTISSIVKSLSSSAAAAASSSSTLSRNNATLPTSSAVNSTTSSVIRPTSSAAIPSSSTTMTTISTDEAGSTKIITQVVTSIPSSTPSTDSDAASNTYTSSNNEDSSSLSTPAIIGISVGAGVLVLSLIACAVWRMKRRHGDEDEAIRWPELNRHGDADTHHALPARVTGQHGIETNPLQRSLSNSSSIFAPSSIAPPHSAPPMALNGSGFGAASSLEDYDYDYRDKHEIPPVPAMPTSSMSPSHYYSGGSPRMDYDDDYASLPPAVGMAQGPPGLAYDSESEGHGPQMSMTPGHQGVTRYQGI